MMGLLKACDAMTFGNGFYPVQSLIFHFAKINGYFNPIKINGKAKNGISI